MPERSRALAVLVWLTIVCAVASVGAIFAMRRELIPNDPRQFAYASAGVLAVAFVTFVVALFKRAPAAGVFSLGLLLVYGSGMANYLYSLQGFTLLNEFESVRLDRGAELQQFEAGPLSNPAEMDLRLQLERLELVDVNGGLAPESRIRLIRSGNKARTVTVSESKGATDGTLRFIQGAFGFAPRIVVTRNGEAIFDRYVPFTTRRIGTEGISFEQTFKIEAEKLTVRSALDVQSVEGDVKGHARLGVAVTSGGKDLGRGELTIGHFAKLSNGLYIGYAGLKRWSEIDISRRNYPQPAIAGVALVALSLVVWPFTRRRP